MKRVVIWLLALLLTSPAWAVDSPVLTFTSAADVAAARVSLIGTAWGGGRTTLPTTQPTVVTGVSDPYGGSLGVSLATVNQYTATLAFSQTNVSLLYVPTVWNGDYIILNPGHVETCSWPSIASGYQIPATLTGLLNAHYAVFAENMPNYTPSIPTCGDVSAHNNLFTDKGDTAMQLFIEPSVQAMNYWDAHGGKGYYGMTGLSGGGWSTTVVAAIDPRILVSVPIAGSLPSIYFPTNCGSDPGTAEQKNVAYYTIAGYLNQYDMGASGVGRRQLQILNNADDCCFGPPQWAAACVTRAGGLSWYAFTAAYFRNLQSYSLVPASYNFVDDYCSVSHQISSCALTKVLAEFAAYLHKPPTNVQLRLR